MTRVAGDADDAVAGVAPRELCAVQPRAGLADAVPLERHQRRPVGEVVLRDAAALLADGLGAHRRDPHDADRAGRLSHGGRGEGGRQEPRQEEGAQHVDAQVQLVALRRPGLALAVAEGLHRGVVEEDVQLGLLGFELLCSRPDLLEVGEVQVQEGQVVGGIWPGLFEVGDGAVGLFLGAGRDVDLCVLGEQDLG